MVCLVSRMGVLRELRVCWFMHLGGKCAMPHMQRVELA